MLTILLADEDNKACVALLHTVDGLIMHGLVWELTGPSSLQSLSDNAQ